MLCYKKQKRQNSDQPLIKSIVSCTRTSVQKRKENLKGWSGKDMKEQIPKDRNSREEKFKIRQGIFAQVLIQ
jgi:hypothetical protein